MRPCIEFRNSVEFRYYDCIKSLLNLDLLSLPNSSTVTDDHLSDASRFAQVRILEVHNTSTSDAGLALLKTATKLRRLIANQTKVTGAGIDELHQALPGCEIHWDGGMIAAETQEAKVE